AKKVDSLISCHLGFSRVLMTIGILILHIDHPLAPDDVASNSHFQAFESAHRGVVQALQRLGRSHQFSVSEGRYTQKSGFDLTTSGANEGFWCEMSVSIVFSTFDYPKSPSYRESTIFCC
ncbi:hypothetical protein PMAYCL1PPCAC_09886, partial [Pristionchus mayeri]